MFGAIYNSDWVAGSFLCDTRLQDQHLLVDEHAHWKTVILPDGAGFNINLCEFIPIYVAICRWGHLWENKQVLCLSDNTQTVQMVNLGKSESLLCMHYIREVFWMCVKFNCHLVSRHIPGASNTIPDLLSRLIQ